MRWLAPRSRVLTCLLSGIPLLCTHYLGAISKLGSSIENPGAVAARGGEVT
jgi:hypothetical protein